MEKIKLADDDLNWKEAGSGEDAPSGNVPSSASAGGGGVGLPKLSADVDEYLPPPDKPADGPVPLPSGGHSGEGVGLPKLSAEGETDAPVGRREENAKKAAPALVIPKISPPKRKKQTAKVPAAAAAPVPEIHPPRGAKNTIAAVPDDDDESVVGRSGREGSDGENAFPETACVPQKGSVVGAYELRGDAVPAGSFVIFQAYHANLDTCRMLEFLNGGDAGSIREFLTHARAAAAADAPNLRSIIEVGEDRKAGYFYAVTENVAPRNLRGLAGYGHFSTAQTTRMLSAAADALCAMERNKLCHGALSPELVLFSEDYLTLKIAGLELGTQFTLSANGDNAAYMAPECREGRTADIRSDLYSLGVIFYEAVTGKLPPPGRRGYVGADPREASANVAGPIAVILMRLLSLEPSARYNTAAEFAAALHAVEAECLATGSDKLTPQPGAPAATAAAPGFRPGRRTQISVGTGALLLAAWRIACGILIVWILVLAAFRIADGLHQLPPDDTAAKAALQAANEDAQRARAELENIRRRAALIAQIEEENRK